MKIRRGSTKFRYGIARPEQMQEVLTTTDNMIGLAFVGRSNVGKSSMINSLFGNNVAKTSKTPGRTREINIFTFSLEHEGKEIENLPSFYLFDLPGYGFAEVGQKMKENWNQLIGTFFEYAPQSTAMVNLQDSRHPHAKADQDFHQFLKNYDFHTILTFNKIDKLKTQKERAQLNKLKPNLFKEYKWVKQIFFASAEKKKGVPELEAALIDFLIAQFDLSSESFSEE